MNKPLPLADPLTEIPGYASISNTYRYNDTVNIRKVPSLLVPRTVFSLPLRFQGAIVTQDL
jgi:hypothetical protein